MKWPSVKLSSFCQTGSGGTPSTKKKDIYYGGNIPWVKSGELKDDILLSTEESLTEAGLNDSAAKLVPSGTILMAMYGATVGKTALLGIDATTNQAVCNIIPDPQIAESKYVWYVLRERLPQLLAKRVGGAQPNISQKIIRDTLVQLPSISEQRRIVKILDQADTLKKKRAEADAKAARILPALFYKMFGDPATNPMGFPLVSIKKLTERIERRNPSDEPESVFKYVDIAGVDGISGSIMTYKTLTGNEAPSRARQIIKTKDVLISTVRPYLRATALVPPTLNNEICSTGFCVLRARNGQGFGYLYALSRLQWSTDLLNSMARGASYPAVTDNDIFGLSVPYPKDNDLIKRFDSIILDYLENNKKFSTSAKKINTLFASILHNAFTGDLTAKWREAHMKELLTEMEAQQKFLVGEDIA